MNKLHKIIEELTPEFEYRVKFAKEPSNEEISKINARLLDRYDASEIGPLKRLMFTERPLDFYELDCGEIWMFDFKCKRGVATNVLMYEIGNLLKWSEALIRVRSTNEPREIEMEESMEDIDFDEYETVIGQDVGEAIPDAGELVGQERADKAVKDGLDSLNKESKYSQYMSAAFGKEKK